MNKLKLPMRDGVGVIILNKKNEVFVGKRKDNPIDKWQMPQGGIDDGEDYISAMKRELLEETSIKSIEILKEIIGIGHSLNNHLLIYDTISSEMRKVKIKKDKNCQLCGTNPTITSIEKHKDYL